ncbi:Uu.00g043270.m01.CDS01 [Anthostomella pinea]|uniref:Uu.00g043270.m01.CDS01 n=1 Tax=Anthostomella pinea TaxID=933095 RepID=A0AAI8VAM8_9PEZI|nr:Uu.00g043270.m01.CDS01 [Anthostomella pinea]
MQIPESLIAVLALALRLAMATPIAKDIPAGQAVSTTDEPYPQHIKVVPDFFKRSPRADEPTV